MSKNWHFNPGDHNAICDSCGRKFKASDLKKRWDGLYVCSDDWEPRHSLDFVRSYPDKITVDWNRPQLPMVFNDVQGIYETVGFTESFSRSVAYHRAYSDTINLYEVVLENETEYTADVAALSESGTMTLPLYTDGTYFAEDYIATSQTII